MSQVFVDLVLLILEVQEMLVSIIWQYDNAPDWDIFVDRTISYIYNGCDNIIPFMNLVHFIL